MSKTIKTNRLVLRQAKDGDAVSIARQLNNFTVSGNLAVVPFPYHVKDAEDWLATWHDDALPIERRFLITMDDDVAIGDIGFHRRGDISVFGYWLGEAFWGRGIMTEAAVAVLEWYFSQTDDDTVLSGVFHFNMASLAIQQKLGFVETGRHMCHSVARNEDVEHIDTEVTKDGFEAACTNLRHKEKKT